MKEDERLSQAMVNGMPKTTEKNNFFFLVRAAPEAYGGFQARG